MDESGDGITKEDFLQSGWEGVIAECDDKECARYSSRFNARAREAEESGDKKGQQIFVLLSGVARQAPFARQFHSLPENSTVCPTIGSGVILCW
jgi:hypothetical protein